MVAKLTATRPRTVEAWLRNGVPHRHFGLLVEYATAHGIRGVTHATLYTAKQESLRDAAE